MQVCDIEDPIGLRDRAILEVLYSTAVPAHDGHADARRRADIRFIQQMLGHEDLKTTQIYTQVAIRTLQQVHAATHPAALLEHGEEPSPKPADPDPKRSSKPSLKRPKTTANRSSILLF